MDSSSDAGSDIIKVDVFALRSTVDVDLVLSPPDVRALSVFAEAPQPGDSAACGDAANSASRIGGLTVKIGSAASSAEETSDCCSVSSWMGIAFGGTEFSMVGQAANDRFG